MKNITTEEKIQLLIGKDTWTLHNCNGKIHEIVVSDGPMGVRQPARDNIDGGDLPSIAYPSSQTLSFTWNPELARKVGNAIANDCIDRDMDIILGPGVNIKRVPLCGRNFEYFSEDPLVAGQMAREYIRGVQEKNIGTSLKHFCCNNIEYARNWISSDVDERTLREIYLRPFEIACEAKPWTVMCAYNLVNGTRMSENKELYGVLRDEFGFDGVIVSDWGAVQDRIASLDAGLDVEMPASEEHVKQLSEAYEKGTLDMEKLEQSAERLLALAEKCESSAAVRRADMTVEEREQVSLDGAREGIVLLKNNGVLPLNTDSRILVTGAPCNHYYFGGGSSAVVLRNKYVSLVETLAEQCPNSFYSESVIYGRCHCASIGNIPGALRDAKTADISIVCVGNNDVCEVESYDRQHIRLAREEIDTIKSIAKNSKKTVVAVYAGCAIDMSDWIEDVDAVVWAGYGGEFVNYALADILTGALNPSGKLTETLPIHLEDVPAMNSYRDELRLVYGEKLNVGYRYFNSAKAPVLFPFGFGLSYSEFKYSNIAVEGSGCELTVSFDIENISDIDGKEIAQLYIRPIEPKVERPEKELRAFCKLDIPAQGKKRASLKLDRHAFAYYSTESKSWTVDSGRYEIQICSDVETVRLTETVNV